MTTNIFTLLKLVALGFLVVIGLGAAAGQCAFTAVPRTSVQVLLQRIQRCV